MYRTNYQITRQITTLKKINLRTFLVHWLFNVTLHCIKLYRLVVSEQFHEYMSTVSGPSPRVAFGIGDGISASLPAGHVLKIALVTMESQL